MTAPHHQPRHLHLAPPLDTEPDAAQAAHERALSVFANRQEEANEVAAEALALIARPPGAFLWFPYPELHRLLGPIAEEELWIWPGMSGHGKTTMLMSLYDHWVTDDTPGMYVGLETSRKVLYIQWACRRMAARGVALHPGDVLKGRLGENAREPIPNAKYLREELITEIETLRSRYAETGRLAPVQWLTARNVPKIAAQAAMWGMKFVIFDHLDHIEVDENNPSDLQAQKAMLRALHMAKMEYGVTLIGAAQMNTSVLQKPGGTVRAHQPPTLEMVAFGMEKRKICDGMVASYKPLPQMPERPELISGYRAAMRMMRDDPSLVRRFLIPETMGVVLMKDRAFGREGDTCMLGVVNSRVTSANPLNAEDAQRRMATFGSQMQDEDRPVPRPRTAAPKRPSVQEQDWWTN